MANEKTLTLNKALEIAEKKGVTMSRNGLRTAAIRNGIMSDEAGEGREKNLLDAARFGEWVVKVARKPPANFTTIATASKELGLSNTRVFKLIKEHDIEHDFYGLGRTIYFDFETLQQKIEQAKALRAQKSEAQASKPKKEKKEKSAVAPAVETDDEDQASDESAGISRDEESGDIADPLEDDGDGDAVGGEPDAEDDGFDDDVEEDDEEDFDDSDEEDDDFDDDDFEEDDE